MKNNCIFEFIKTILISLIIFVSISVYTSVFTNVSTSISISVFTSTSCFASTPNGFEGYFNGITGPQQVNQNNKPRLTDNENMSEEIDPASGTVKIRQTDLSLPGKDGLDLNIGRFYNSSQAEVTTKKMNVTSTIGTPQTGPTGYYINITRYSKKDGAYVDCYIYPQMFSSTTVMYSWITFINNGGIDDNLFYCQVSGYGYYYNPTYYTPTTYTFVNSPDVGTYYRERYDLGTGWSMNFPSIQRVSNDDNIFGSWTYLYYHDGAGGSYKVSNSLIDTQSNLEGYQGIEIKFLRDSTYNNGSEDSYYKVITIDGKATYFNYEGNIIGIKDRFGNEIKFTYVSRTLYSGVVPNDGHNGVYKSISKITDSVGRTVDFTYTNNINNATFTDDTITVIVKDPTGAKNVSFIYTKTRDTITKQGVGTYYEPRLSSVTNIMGLTTQYNYQTDGLGNIPNNRFKFDVKDLASGASNVGTLLISSVQYPHSVTYFSYDTTIRNLGTDGACDANRVVTRYDRYLKWNTVTNRYDIDTTDLNRVTYSYTGDYTGYPTYKSGSEMTADAQFYSLATFANGISTKTQYNGLMQLGKTETTSSNGEKKVTNYLEYDVTFTQKPSKIETLDYASDNSIVNKLWQKITYVDWGGIASQSAPITPAQYVDGSILANTTTISYEPTYKMVSSKSYYRDESTQLTESNTYTAEGRPLTNVNAKGETTNYSYTTAMVNGKIVVTQVDATKSLENGKTAKTSTLFDATTGYAYPITVKNYYTNDQGVYTSTQSTATYNMLFGVVETQTDNSGNVTSFTYDNAGRVLTKTLPDFKDIDNNTYKSKQVSVYNDLCYSNDIVDNENKFIAGMVVTQYMNYTKTDSNNQNPTTYNQNITYQVYDGFGKLRQDEYWDASLIVKQRALYDNMLRPIKAFDATGNASIYSYDAWGRVNETLDTYGNLYRTDFDIKNNKTTAYFVAQANIATFRADNTNANVKESVVESYTDVYGRTIEYRMFPQWPTTTGYLSEKYTYDIANNLKTYLDPNGNKNEDNVTKKYFYDALNRVTQVKDALNQVSEVSYSISGNISKIRLKANMVSNTYVDVYSKEYDELGMNTKKTDPALQNTIFSHNALGQVTSITDRNGNTFTSSYDSQGRQTSDKAQVTANGNSLEYRTLYNSHYGPARIDDYVNNVKVGSLSLTNNQAGQITNRNLIYGGNTYNSYLNNSYDNAGKITSVNVGINGTNYFYTNYHYTGTRLDRVQTDGSQTVNASDTVNATYAYRADGRLQKIIYPKLNDGTYLTTEYTYNPLGRVLSMANKKGATVLSQFSYTYDGNGNIISVVDTSGTSTYAYDQLNRLTEAHRADGSENYFDYDLRGNRLTLQDTNPTISTTAVNFGYDARDRLTSVTQGAITVNMKYRADGLRYKKQSTAKTVLYHYNEAGKVVAQGDGTGAITSNYVWGADRLLMKKSGANKYYYLYNGHGDVVQMVNTTGQVVNSYFYDEWGNPINTEGNSGYGKVVLDDKFDAGLVNWQNTSNASINNGKVTVTNNENFENKQGNFSNFIYETDVSISNSAAGVTFRKLDSNNYYFWKLLSNGNLSAYKNVNGVKTLIKEVPVGVIQNTNYRIKIEAKGNEIKTYINGNLVDTTIDSTFSRGRVGLREYDIESAIFDNVLVTDLTNATFETVDNSFKYAGEMLDSETGLYYLRARYYDPQMGRFINEDSYEGNVSNPLTLNIYSYCHNNPVNMVDPTGHWAEGDEKLFSDYQKLIRQYGDEWNSAKAAGDQNAMTAAHRKANAVRANNISSGIILNHQSAAMGYGHAAILLINQGGQGFFFSFFPQDGSAVDDGQMRLKFLNPTETNNFLYGTGNVDNITTSDGKVVSESYNRFIYVGVNSENGLKMYNKGMEFFNDPGDYFLIGKSCQSVMRDIASAGDVNVSFDTAPNDSFDLSVEEYYPTSAWQITSPYNWSPIKR